MILAYRCIRGALRLSAGARATVALTAKRPIIARSYDLGGFCEKKDARANEGVGGLCETTLTDNHFSEFIDLLIGLSFRRPPSPMHPRHCVMHNSRLASEQPSPVDETACRSR